ncbi:hypothetical protein GQR58_029976 [Nymphon striatum]|nr:hypothetical protein GQR58_029976 [Nymphon striatum]
MIDGILASSDGGLNDVSRRREIGFAGTEADDGFARCLQCLGGVGDGQEISGEQPVPADCQAVNPRDSKPRKRQSLAPVVGTILAIGLVLTGAIGLFYRYQETTKIQEALAGESDVFAASLEDGLTRAASAYETLLSSSDSSVAQRGHFLPPRLAPSAETCRATPPPHSS